MTTISVELILAQSRFRGAEKTYGTIEDVFVALTLDVKRDVGGITRGNIRLGHEEGRTDLAFQQGLEPFVLLSLCTVLGQHLHVSSVRSGTVCGLGGGATLAQILSHEAVLEVAEASTLLEVVLWQEHIP